MKFLSMSLMSAALPVAVACGLGAAALVYKKVSGTRKCKEQIQKTRDKREEGFKRAEQKVLQYKEQQPKVDTTAIVALPLQELQMKLRLGSLCPEDVLYSYMEKTLALQPRLNCSTEILLDSFEEVKAIESKRDRLLYGVPISIKDNIGCKGYDSTCGLVMNLGKPVLNDSVVVEVLKMQGAIPFVKTNVPQAMLSFDCSNPIFGKTVNPLNALKTPGGSSGGEGALIGGGGSLLGLGTDVGGSIRVPASFCGICGLKPTSGRLSSWGLRPILPGQKSLKAAIGPMARDVDSVAQIMEALLCDYMFSLDPTVPPLPFNKLIYQSSTPLRIGYMLNDGYTEPSPSMARAITETKALLEKAGHVLVPYEPLDTGSFLTELEKGTFGDGATSFLENLKEGPLEPTFSNQRFLLSLPKWVKKVMAFLLKPVWPRVSTKINAICGIGCVQNLWKNHTVIEEYTAKTIAHWKKSNIDVLLCPAVGPAYQSSESHKIPQCLSYTVVYNGMDFPAGIVPVSTVTAEDEEQLKHYKGNYGDFWDKSFKKIVSGGEGLPMAVQCVALPWQEELCLRFMKEVERLVKESRN